MSCLFTFGFNAKDEWSVLVFKAFRDTDVCDTISGQTIVLGHGSFKDVAKDVASPV